MNKKLKKTGEIIAISAASLNLIISLTLFVTMVDLGAFEVGTFLSIIVSFFCIIFCAIDLGRGKEKATIVSLIFVGLCFAFAIYLTNFAVTVLLTYGYSYPLLTVALGYASICLHKNIFSKDVEENAAIEKTVNEPRKVIIEEKKNETNHTNPLKAIEKLYELKEQKLISDEEYEEKRAEIISKM